MDKLNIILETFENLNDKGAIDEGLYLSSCNALKDIASSITHTRPEAPMTAAEVAAVLGNEAVENISAIRVEQRRVALSHSEEFKDILTESYRYDNFVLFENPQTGYTAFFRVLKSWLTADNISNRKAMWKAFRSNGTQASNCFRNMLYDLWVSAKRTEFHLLTGTLITKPVVPPAIAEHLTKSIFGKAIAVYHGLLTKHCIRLNWDLYRKGKGVNSCWDLEYIGLHKNQDKPSMRKVNTWLCFKKTWDNDTERTIQMREWEFWTDRIQLGRMFVVDRLTMLSIMNTLEEFVKRMDEKPLRPYPTTYPDLETHLILLKKGSMNAEAKSLKLVTSGVSGRTVGQNRCYQSKENVVITPTRQQPFITMEFAEVWDDKKVKK